MFERFTERARQVVVLAQEEARDNEVEYIGAEHILMGLLLEDEGIAARVLNNLGVKVEDTHAVVKARSSGPKPTDKTSQLPFTPRAKKVLELSLREALHLGHNYIGTEHILLGLLREGDNTGLEILHSHNGLTVDSIRNEVMRMLAPRKVSKVIKETKRNDDDARVINEGELYDLLNVAILMARQDPERPALRVANAALALTGLTILNRKAT